MRKLIVSLIGLTMFLTIMGGVNAQGATKTLRVRAENDYNQPGYSTQIKVYTNGIYRGTLYFVKNDNSWTVESLQVPEYPASVRLEFAFDWCGGCISPGYTVDGGDLNAYIDWLEVGSIHIEAEDFDRTGYGNTVVYYEGYYAPYGVDYVSYSASAGSIKIDMAHDLDWVEYDMPTMLPILVDIKPGSDQNPINIDGRGVIPVAILTTEEFDAAEVNPDTVLFGPLGAYPEHYALEDVDLDGDMDMVLHFRTQDAGIAPEDTEAVLTAETYEGLLIEGSDSVRVLESKGKRK